MVFRKIQLLCYRPHGDIQYFLTRSVGWGQEISLHKRSHWVLTVKSNSHRTFTNHSRVRISDQTTLICLFRPKDFVVSTLRSGHYELEERQARTDHHCHRVYLHFLKQKHSPISPSSEFWIRFDQFFFFFLWLRLRS